MTPIIATIIIITSLGTAFLSSIFGMLGGVVMMALLVSVLPVAAAFVLHGLIQFASNAYRGVLNRSHIQWRIIIFVASGSAIILAGLSVVSYVPDQAIVLLLLGLLPFGVAALPDRLALDATRPAHAVAAGIAVGAATLLSGVGGPLLDVFFQRTQLTRHQVVATKAITQAIAHSIKIIYFGLLIPNATENLPALWLLAVCLVTTLIGTTLGKRVLDNMEDAVFFKWTGRILMTLGAVLIVRAIILLTAP